MCQVIVKRAGQRKAETREIPTPETFTGETAGFQPSKVPARPVQRPIIIGYNNNRTKGRANIRCY